MGLKVEPQSVGVTDQTITYWFQQSNRSKLRDAEKRETQTWIQIRGMGGETNVKGKFIEGSSRDHLLHMKRNRENPGTISSSLSQDTKFLVCHTTRSHAKTIIPILPWFMWALLLSGYVIIFGNSEKNLGTNGKINLFSILLIYKLQN